MFKFLSKYPWFITISKSVRFKKTLVASIYFAFLVVCSLIFSVEKLFPFNYVIIGIVIIFAILLIVYLIFFGKLRFHYYILLSVTFILLQFFSWVINGFGNINFTGILLGLMSLAIFELTLQDDFKISLLIKLMLLSTWLFILFFIVYYRKSILSYSFGSKMVLNFGNSNDIARSMAYAFVINYSYIFVKTKKYIKIPLVLASVICIVFIFMIGSVSNLLTSVVVLGLTPIILVKKKQKILFVLILIGVVVTFVFLLKMPFMEYFNRRLSGMMTSMFGTGGSGDDSFVYRFRGAYYGFQLFFRQPFFGWGFDSVYNNYVIMAHNNISEIASDFGVFALIIEEFFIVYPFIKVFISRKSYFADGKSFIVVSLLYMFLFQLFLVSFNSKIECIILPICFGFVASCEKKEKENNDYCRINI